MKWTAYCMTCCENLVLSRHGVVGIMDDSIVEAVAWKHMTKTSDHHVIVGYFIDNHVTVPKALRGQKREVKHE